MYLYILYSPKLNRYYKGVYDHPEQRFMEHNTAIKTSAYTAVTNDWELIFQLKCESKSQALKIERYLKNQPILYISNDL